MALPNSRNTTYAAGSQLKSADLNDIQDRLVDITNKLPGTFVMREWVIYPSGLLIPSNSSNQEIVKGKLNGTTHFNTTIATNFPGGTPNPAPFPYAALTIQDAASSQGARVFTREETAGFGGQLVGDLDNTIAVFQAALQMSAIGANEVDIGLGLHESPNMDNPSFAHAQAMFIKETGDTNWQCKVSDRAAYTTTDSGVAPVADTWQVFRIEYHGANTPIGVANSGATVEYFIDGNSVAKTATANVPTGTKGLGANVHARATSTGPSSDVVVRASPIEVAWAPFAL